MLMMMMMIDEQRDPERSSHHPGRLRDTAQLSRAIGADAFSLDR